MGQRTSIVWAALLGAMLGACRAPSTVVVRGAFKGITPVVASVPSHYRFFQGLVINKTITESRFPILPYVFFDSASTSIPQRYNLFTDAGQTGTFNDSSAVGDHIAWHRHLLNVIGFRMRRFPATTISIASCTPGAPAKGERIQVVERRARVIGDYLVGIWGVDPSRIHILPPRELPATSSQGSDRFAAEENRRVEISSSDYDLMKPIVSRDIRLYPAPAGFRFRLRNPVPDSLVERRTIEIRRGGNPWNTITGIGRGDTLTPEIPWGRNGARDSIPTDESPYVARLVVTDLQGREYRSDTATIPVEIVDMQKRLRYGQARATIEIFMLLFPDTVRIGPVAERFMKEQIVPLIDSSSHVQIVGGGDYPMTVPVVNPDEIAQRVERARRNADEVLKGLKRMMGTVEVDITVGTPAIDPLYKGRTPEERFYLRAVTIRIVTPTRK